MNEGLLIKWLFIWCTFAPTLWICILGMCDSPFLAKVFSVVNPWYKTTLLSTGDPVKGKFEYAKVFIICVTLSPIIFLVVPFLLFLKHVVFTILKRVYNFIFA